MRKFWLLAVVVASGMALAEEGDEGLVERCDDNAWHLTIGPVMAPRVRVRVRGPRMVAPVRLDAPSSSSRSGGSGSSAANPSSGYVAREYIDGYVRPDEGTDDPKTAISGLTWNWGADDVGSQYSGGRMEFHTEAARWTESISQSSSSFGVGSGFASDRDVLLGVEAMGGWTFYDGDAFDAAIDGGFRFYGSGDLKASSIYGTSVTTTKTRSEYRYVDSYDASGWSTVPSGSYEGSEGGPGRLLGATPTRREELVNSTGSSETDSQLYRSSTRLDYRIWDIRLGPTAGWKATDWLTIRSGVYGLLGIVDARLRSSSGRASSCDTVFGMAASLSAQVNITDNLFLFGGAEYDWWSDNVALKSGGANAHIKLSDFTVSCGLGVEF